MTRLISYLLMLAAATAALAWLADKPGTLTVDWNGYEGRLSVLQAVVLLLVFMAVIWLVISLVLSLIASPGSVSRYVSKRRQQQGLEALTNGMIAVGAGDRQLAARYATQANRALPNEPLTDLLRAQTAQLAGDRKTAQRVYEQMLITPQTELLGLRGLYLDAERNNDLVAARSLAEQALKRVPKIAWASQALFDVQCRQSDWPGALETLASARRSDLVPRKVADRRRAVLMTAQAMALEESDAAKSEALALEAHDLAPDLVPAAAIAGRLLAARGRMQKASAVIEQTWRRSPHPDLAVAYAFARPGDSPRDRMLRVRKLAGLTPGNREGVIAVANAAIEARSWDQARAALEPLLADGLSARVCVLMARTEGGEKGDQGRVREWLARAIHAPRDPVWVADGHVSDHWAPISPVSHRLDAYEWKVAEERNEKVNGALLLEELAQYAMTDSGAVATPPARKPNPSAIDAEEVVARPAASAAPSSAVLDTDGPASPKDLKILNADATTQAQGANSPAPATRTQTRRTPSARPGTEQREPVVEYYVPPRAPDDPGPEAVVPLRKAAS